MKSRNWFFFAALLPPFLYVYFVFVAELDMFYSLEKRCGLFACCALISSVILAWWKPNIGWTRHLFNSAFALAILHRVMLFVPEISTSPWSLSWSEGSRYYYASLYFSHQLYGIAERTSLLHPGRYLLQSIPFLLPGSPIWLHRLWQVLLWLATSLGTGWLLTYRLQHISASKSAISTVVYIGWSFLFLMQGPVYYHLLVIVMIILWGTRPRLIGRTLIVVIIASVWAGLTRLNWYPMPGFLAAAIYFLEVPFDLKRQIGVSANRKTTLRALAKYAFPATVWLVLGTITALITTRLYVFISGNPLQYVGSPFTSRLLWYRLWPNATNPAGLLPSIAATSIPLVIIIFYSSLNSHSHRSSTQVLGLFTILGILFAGGLLVSVKIGGGSNLHNLDAYLVMLWLIGTYYFYGFLSSQQNSQHKALIVNLLAFFAFLIPMIGVIGSGGPWPRHNPATEQAELEQLRQALIGAKGEVLFLSERQLLTFGEIRNLALAPQHEKLFLMEMAMANNQDYLERFHAELAVYRYSYIVTDTINIAEKGEDYSFGEENDIWVDRVSQPLLCYYEPILTLNDASVQLLVPRATNCRAR